MALAKAKRVAALGTRMLSELLGISSLLLMRNRADAIPCENFGVFLAFRRNLVEVGFIRGDCLSSADTT